MENQKVLPPHGFQLLHSQFRLTSVPGPNDRGVSRSHPKSGPRVFMEQWAPNSCQLSHGGNYNWVMGEIMSYAYTTNVFKVFYHVQTSRFFVGYKLGDSATSLPEMQRHWCSCRKCNRWKGGLKESWHCPNVSDMLLESFRHDVGILRASCGCTMPSNNQILKERISSFGSRIVTSHQVVSKWS